MKSLDTLEREYKESQERSTKRRNQKLPRGWVWWMNLLLVLILVGGFLGGAIYLIVILG